MTRLLLCLLLYFFFSISFFFNYPLAAALTGHLKFQRNHSEEETVEMSPSFSLRHRFPQLPLPPFTTLHMWTIKKRGRVERCSSWLVQTDNRWGAVTRVLALMFMISVICTKFRPIKARFVSWAVRPTQVKGSICLNNFRSPEEFHGTASAFVTMSTEGKGSCAHLNIQKRQLAILTLVVLCSLWGSLTFSVHRQTG